MVRQVIDMLRELLDELHPVCRLSEGTEANNIGREEHKHCYRQRVVLLAHLYLAVEHMLVSAVVFLDCLAALSRLPLGLLNLIPGALYSVCRLHVRITLQLAPCLLLRLLGHELRLHELSLV